MLSVLDLEREGCWILRRPTAKASPLIGAELQSGADMIRRTAKLRCATEKG